MFPAVAPKFFSTRKEGPKNLGKDPAAATAPPAPGAGKKAASGPGPLLAPVTYEIKVKGKAHKVTVAPA